MVRRVMETLAGPILPPQSCSQPPGFLSCRFQNVDTHAFETHEKNQLKEKAEQPHS